MFEPANNLEKSLMSAASNPSSRPQFYRDLLEADIFIIQHGENNFNIQNNVLQQGSQLKIQHIERDGKSWLPIFSSLQRLQQFIRSEAKYLQIKAKDFFEITRGAHIVLNPGFDYGKEFIPQEIAQMLDGSIFKPSQTYVAKKETKVLIGQPAVYPTKLVKALSEYFATNKFVDRAYLVQFHNPESGEPPHLLIGLDASGDWEKVLGDAGLIGSEVMGKDEIIDFMRLNSSNLSQHIINSSKPIYEKSFSKK
jgi:SseB protein C-terminal domain/SseB protein N-terminal domain